ncbi:hypothetical protein PY365_16620 [Roseiarcaceae bacterium H3SJ34-1]|uniref:hypothetical protein n=1 Tax=Terripilifer ovatus TaxID=3032367 RepID=UPI003AB95E04|nr:hypothetical protein [Roseiarcaceae bacterium H3SJ34-1]
MLRKSTKLGLIIAFAGCLAACQTPLVDQTGPLSIQSVSVSTKPIVKSATDIGPAIERATRATVVREMPNGRPANLLISVDGVNYKNPVASLLIGSRNSVGTTVSVADKSGAIIAQFQHIEAADEAVQGIIGAAISANQDPVDVDHRLTQGYARTLALRIYGEPGHQPAAAPVAAPAPEAAPPAAAPTSRRSAPTS